MTEKTIKVHMKQRRDTRANWAAVNPVLYDGELGFVSDDPNLYKIGDGETAWNDLPFRGFDGTISQETGSNTKAVMSQNAVTQELEKKQDVIEDLEQIRENANNALKSIPDKYVEDTELNDALSGKQDAIEDLDTIRSGAEKGATALQSVPDEYVKDTELKTINGESITGEGDLIIKPGVSEEDILSNEKVTAAALNDLDSKIKTLPTKGTVANKIAEALAVERAQQEANMAALQEQIAALSAELEAMRAESASNEKVTAAALNDLNNRLNN